MKEKHKIIRIDEPDTCSLTATQIKKQLQSFILPIVLHFNKEKLAQLVQCTFQWIIQDIL